MKVYIVMVHYLEPADYQSDYVNIVLQTEKQANAIAKALNELYLRERKNKVAWVDIRDVY